MIKLFQAILALCDSHWLSYWQTLIDTVFSIYSESDFKIKSDDKVKMSKVLWFYRLHNILSQPTSQKMRDSNL